MGKVMNRITTRSSTFTLWIIHEKDNSFTFIPFACERLYALDGAAGETELKKTEPSEGRTLSRL